MNTNQATRRKIQIPHIIILFAIIILIMCLMTCILPAGQYEVGTDGKVIAGSYHLVERNPVSPWEALKSLQQCIIDSGLLICLMINMGACINVMTSTGAIDEVVMAAVNRIGGEKAVKVLVPAIFFLISLIGAFAGCDAMICLIPIGILFCRRIGLDKVTAVAMMYLSMITGQGIGPTIAIVMIAHQQCGLPGIAGFPMRMLVWLVLTSAGAIYTMRYALKVYRDPTKSVNGGILHEVEGQSINVKAATWKSYVATLILVGNFALYGIGGYLYGWGYEYLNSIAIIAAALCAAVYCVGFNEFGRRYLMGACSMGSIALLLGISKIIGTVMNKGNITHTIVHSVVSVLENTPAAVTCIGILIFIMVFNLLIPSGTSKVFIIFPILVPMADLLGVSRSVLCMAYQLGDGFTNGLTPVNAATMGALERGDNCDWTEWAKFLLPCICIYFVIGAATVFLLQTFGWVAA